MEIFRLFGSIFIENERANKSLKDTDQQAEKVGKTLQSTIKTASKWGQEIGKQLTTVGTNISKKAGVPLAALTALMGGLAKTTADYGDRVAKQAQQIGLSVQSYQELEYAMGQNGVSTQEFEMSIGNLNQRMGMARRGNEQYRKTLEKLGFNLDELDKGAISTEESFNQIVAALADMDDGQMQAAIASDFFGTRVARRLIPAIRGGAEGIEALRQRAHDLGLVMDEEFTRRSEEFGDTMDDLSRATGGLGRAFGKELLAPLINLGKWVTDIVSGVTGWIEENPKLVRQIIIWGGAIAGVLGVLVTLGTTMIVTGKIIGALGAVFNILTSKPLLIIAAIGLLWLAWENDWGNIRTTTETVVERVLELWDSLTEWWDTSPLLKKIREIWNDAIRLWEEMTLPEKALGLITITATITWGLTFLKTFLGALLPMAGIKAATGAAATLGKYALALGALVVAAKIIWNLLPEDIKLKVQELWQGVAQAIRDFNLKTINNPFVEKITELLENLPVDGWELPALTVGVTFAAFKLLQTGAVIAGKLGGVLATLLSGLSIPLATATVAIGAFTWLFSDDEERKKLLAKIEEIWGDEQLSTVVKLAQVTVEVAKWVFPNLVDVLDENIFAPIRAALGLEKTQEAEMMQDYLLADEESRAGMVKDFRERTADSELAFVNPPTWWERFLGWIGIVKETPDEIRKTADELDSEFDSLLDAIYRAEGGANARVPYGMTGFADAGNKFGNASNQALFEELSQGMAKGSEEYYRTAALVSAQHYWGTFAEKFPDVAGQTFEELSPEMQQMFVLHMGRWFSPPDAHELNKNWVPNVLSALGHGDVAKEFRAGSENIMDAWIEGIYDKADDVEAVADYISQILADYIVGGSPTEKGALSVPGIGGGEIMDEWGEALAEGAEENESLISKAVTKIKELLTGVWEGVPEEIRLPIEDAIKKAEDALFKLDDLQQELEKAIAGGSGADEQATGFIGRLTKALEEKLGAVDEPLNRFVDMVSSAALHLGEVVKAVSSGDWVGAVLSIIMETESFAKAMELIGKVLAPVVTLFDAVLRPIIEGLLKLWNGIIDALVSINIFGWQPFKGLAKHRIEDDPGDDGGSGRGSSSGRQISEITGPTRDLLTDLLAPLANFGQIVAPIQDIRNILYERLPNFESFGMDFAGAGAIGGDIVFESGAIVINSSGTSATELSRDMMDAIDREMGRRYNSRTRGRGGR